MEVSFNPGHTEELRQLGILAENQTNISADALANNLAQSLNLDAALYVLQQELAQSMSFVLNFDYETSTLEEDMDAAVTMEQLQPTVEYLSAYVGMFTHAAQRAELFNLAMKVIDAKLTASNIPLSSNAQRYLRNVKQTLEKMTDFAITHEKENLKKLTQLQTKLHATLDRLNPGQ